MKLVKFNSFNYVIGETPIQEGDTGWAYSYGTSLVNEGRGRITFKVLEDNGKHGLYFYKIFYSDEPVINKDLQDLKERYKLALLQLQKYSDNELIESSHKWLNIKDELKSLNV